MKHDDVDEHIYLDDDDQNPPKSSGRHSVSAVESKEEYKKLWYVLGGILLVSSFLSFIRGIELNRFMADFMAVFFITFAAFKFYDIEGFAHGYRNYDIIAKNIRPWGYAFPFIEAFLGFWYLLSEGPLTLNLLTMLITGTAAIGVWGELRRKSRFRCACLGGVIRLPLSRVSFVENVTMFAMAFFMIFL